MIFAGSSHFICAARNPCAGKSRGRGYWVSPPAPSIWVARKLSGSDWAPSVLGLACLHGARKISRAALQRTAGLLGFACLIAALAVLAVCVENKRNYGWFGTCELRSSSFDDAYAALLRVRAAPVETLAKVSPKFAELRGWRLKLTRMPMSWRGPCAMRRRTPATTAMPGRLTTSTSIWRRS